VPGSCSRGRRGDDKEEIDKIDCVWASNIYANQNKKNGK